MGPLPRGPLLVVLGASNVVPVRAGIVASVRDALGPPRCYFACGHGRGYALGSRVLIRWLPAIRDCGLWGALSDGGTAPRASQPDGVSDGRVRPARVLIVTDVGNDLMYGATVDRVLAAVEDCVARAAAGGPVGGVLVGPPKETLLRLSRWRFEATRRLFFPRSGLRWEAMRSAVEELDAGLRRLAERCGLRFLPAAPQWYGFDPIHIRRTQRGAAWSRILGAAFGRPIPWRQACSAIRRGLCCRMPNEYAIASHVRHTPQPVLTLPDGTEVSLY